MNVRRQTLSKVPSGISGLDEVTGGGLPKGRASLICGGAGSGKTLLAMTFLVEGALKYDEPGVFMCFEENEDELAANVASLGYDLKELIADKKLAVDYVHVERSEIEETGEYDLDGLFVRLDYAIKSVGAKRVVLDTIEALFWRPFQYRRVARRTAPAVPLAEGTGRDRHHHCRARRRLSHPARAGGICLRLRHHARSPGF